MDKSFQQITFTLFLLYHSSYHHHHIIHIINHFGDISCLEISKIEITLFISLSLAPLNVCGEKEPWQTFGEKNTCIYYLEMNWLISCSCWPKPFISYGKIWKVLHAPSWTIQMFVKNSDVCPDGFYSCIQKNMSVPLLDWHWCRLRGNSGHVCFHFTRSWQKKRPHTCSNWGLAKKKYKSNSRLAAGSQETERHRALTPKLVWKHIKRGSWREGLPVGSSNI